MISYLGSRRGSIENNGSNNPESADDGIAGRTDNDSNIDGGTTTTTAASANNKSLGTFAFLKGVLPPAMIPKYVNSEWSFAQIRGDTPYHTAVVALLAIR
jgi:hypothetical protein